MDPKKKKMLIIGGGVVAAGFVYYSYRSNAVQSNAAATDPNATDPNAVDNTGYTDPGYGDTGGGYSPTPGQNWPPNPSPPPAHVPATNAEWAGQALQFLHSQGYNRTTAGTAITKYLAKIGLSANEYVIIETAIAFIGYPPQNPGDPKHASRGGHGKPPTHHVPKSFENKYYRLLPSGRIFQVAGGKRYHVSPKTWHSFKRKPQTHVIVASSPVMALPYGGTI